MVFCILYISQLISLSSLQLCQWFFFGVCSASAYERPRYPAKVPVIGKSLAIEVHVCSTRIAAFNAALRLGIPINIKRTKHLSFTPYLDTIPSMIPANSSAVHYPGLPSQALGTGSRQ